MENFFVIEMQSTGIQVLESFFIIATSKKIETIISRHDFLLQRLQILKKGQSNPQYSPCAKLTAEHYKMMYYDRPLQDYQLAVLSNPNGFDLSNFYCSSLVNAMKRFCGEQTKEISDMKKETAKIKRAAKVLETIKTTKTELQAKCSSASSYSTALIELENLETPYKITA
jgi:hypothetical protein